MREYLECDWAKHEKNCTVCPGEKDDEGYCSVCKLRPLEERFPPDFRAWVANLTRLYQWHKAGYSLDSEDLSFDEWNCLAWITAWYDAQALAAIMPTGGGG